MNKDLCRRTAKPGLLNFPHISEAFMGRSTTRRSGISNLNPPAQAFDIRHTSGARGNDHFADCIAPEAPVTVGDLSAVSGHELARLQLHEASA
jgi:hypothetical protein